MIIPDIRVLSVYPDVSHNNLSAWMNDYGKGKRQFSCFYR